MSGVIDVKPGAIMLIADNFAISLTTTLDMFHVYE
jgi:hypothetical protein